jgi:hypothetical protein
MKVKELFEDEFIHKQETFKISSDDIEDGFLIDDYSRLILDGDFDAFNLELESLKGCPYQVRDIDIRACKKLKSLKGAPKIVKRNAFCGNTNLTSLEGIGKDYFEEIGDTLFLPAGTITSNILGILKIKKLKECAWFVSGKNDEQAFEILSKHFVSRRLSKCREELIEAGLKEFAKL